MSDTHTKPQLYRGWLSPGKYVWSPFVIKLETRLRLGGIEYDTQVGSIRTAPKGKIPYIKLFEAIGVEPTAIGDSTIIIKHLIEQNILPDLNGAVEPATRAHDLAIRGLMEDKLYFYHSRERWLDNYYAMRDHVLGAVAYPIRVLLGWYIHRAATRNLHAQGTGRYTDEELRLLRREIWENINALLVASKAARQDTGPYWLLAGDEPTEADCTVYGFIVSVLITTAAPESQALVKEFPTIVEYAERIHDRYFPDYEKWTI